MTEFANHAVTLRNGEIRVNLLVPGKYTLQYEGRAITVDITTRYPEKADTLIFVNGAPESMKVSVRIPKWIKNALLRKDVLPGGGVRYVLSGKLGYQLEEARGGVILRYGALIMVPLLYITGEPVKTIDSGAGIPEGYVPENMPDERPAIIPVKQDEDGFYLYSKQPYPFWQYYEEGTISKLAYNDLSVSVPLYFSDGTIRYQRFYPECDSTTTMSGGDLPLIFNKG